MKRTDVIALVFKIAKLEDAFDILEGEFAKITKDELSSNLLECGIIPELFGHDSSEEKLWAKYCDILLAQTLTHLSIPAEVLRARGDSADVFGRTHSYSIVGDAKAFRLSRSAKNQKDFKVQALDDWRKSNTFACLVSPLYQYPRRGSQIYEQAIGRNVTLFSYTHLKFLLDYIDGQNLDSLWRIGNGLPTSKSAQQYWEAIDRTVCHIAGKNEETLSGYKQKAVGKVKQLGKEGLITGKQESRNIENYLKKKLYPGLLKPKRLKIKS